MSPIRTARSVEHPRRNFEPAIRPRIAQCAAENHTIRFVDHLMDCNPHPEPWMPGINKHSENDGPVGVLELRSTIASARIRALLPGRRIAPTSTTCHYSRQHEFRRRCRGITPVGLRPPCVTPRQRHTIMSTGRGSTYRGRNAVSTKPATSVYTSSESRVNPQSVKIRKNLRATIPIAPEAKQQSRKFTCANSTTRTQDAGLSISRIGTTTFSLQPLNRLQHIQHLPSSDTQPRHIGS